MSPVRIDPLLFHFLYVMTLLSSEQKSSCGEDMV